jgi:glycine/D-amino acid oxidase-like deaminating enzyme
VFESPMRHQRFGNATLKHAHTFLRAAMTMFRPNFHTDGHGWAELMPKRKPAPPPPLHHRYKWVIIGAGLTGLSCARRLAQLHPNDEILLLEARQIGQGASGRNSGFTVSTSHFPGGYHKSQKKDYARTNRINQAGTDILRAQVHEHTIDCQWMQDGFYHTAAAAAALRECEYFKHYLTEMGIAHSPLDAQALKNRLGTAHYKAGVFVPSGVLVQPAALVRGLADTLPANVTLAEQTPVLNIDVGVPHVLQLKNESIEADTLFLAINYEAGKLGFLRRRLIGSTLSGSFTQMLSANELASLGSLKQWGVLSLHSGGATVRLTHDGRICLRNTAEYHGGALLSSKALAKRQALHRASFEKRFPQLAHVPFEYAWSGVEGISRNGTNFFGRQHDKLYLAGGYNGSGVSRGTAFGAALADYASGGQSALIDDCLACAPASYLPPRPLLDVGALFTVRSRFKGVGLDR